MPTHAAPHSISTAAAAAAWPDTLSRGARPPARPHPATPAPHPPPARAKRMIRSPSGTRSTKKGAESVDVQRDSVDGSVIVCVGIRAREGQ